MKERSALDPAVMREVNALLFETERKLAPPAGLPHRPWYRHLLTAPGWYTGYAPKILPGVREGIEAKRWAEAEAQAAALGQALDDAAETIERAALVLERGKR